MSLPIMLAAFVAYAAFACAVVPAAILFGSLLAGPLEALLSRFRRPVDDGNELEKERD